MIDGLALGETTPGPLTMVVAFVGFVGAWTKEVFGPDMLLLAGVAGASVVTLFTFTPSFLFILLGGSAARAAGRGVWPTTLGTQGEEQRRSSCREQLSDWRGPGSRANESAPGFLDHGLDCLSVCQFVVEGR